MSKFLIVISLLFIYTFPLFAQGSMVDIRALLRKCNTSHADTTRVKLLLQLSNLYAPNPSNIQRIQDSALLMAVQAKELSQRLGYKQGESDAAFSIGSCYIATNKMTAFRQLLAQVNDTSKIKLMLALAEAQLPNNASLKTLLDSAITYSSEALALAEKIHSARWITDSQSRLATAIERKGDKQKAKALLEQAFNYSRQNNYFKGEVSAYVATAWNYGLDTTLLLLTEKFRTQLLADYNKITDANEKTAAQHAIETGMVDAGIGFWESNSMDLTEKELVGAIDFGKNFRRRDVTPHYNLVYLLLYKPDIEKALFYALDAVKQVEKEGNPDLDERPYINLGKVYSDMHKWEPSLLNYNKAIDLINKKGLLVSGMLLRMIAEVYIPTQKQTAALPLLQNYLDNVIVYDRQDMVFVLESIGNCYYATGQYTKAEKYLLDGVRIAEQSASVADRYNTYEVLAKVYLKMKQYDKARYYMQPVLNDTTINLAIAKRIAHKGMFQIDSVLGNYHSALLHYISYNNIDDSLYNRSKIRQIEELTVQYETQKKDHDIQLLKKQTQLQAVTAQQQKLQRNFLIAGAGMLVLLLIVLYSRYNIKQKSNQLLQVQYVRQRQLTEEKEWLIKEVHHRVKNNLQMIISLLNMQRSNLKNKPDESTFEEISSHIHTISLIHQKLYQVHDQVMVNMQEYISELITCLEESGLASQQIKYELQIEEIDLDASQSVSVGLILNEAVTNAMKYAFPSKEDGILQISFKEADENNLLLSIRDNGVGLSPDFQTTKGSIGFELMEVLSEQLEGELTIQNDDGVFISLLFMKQARIL